MDKVWFEILINALGLIGIIAGILALQCNKHIQVLAFKMAEEGIFGVQYILLGGITGGLLNIVGVLRNLLFAYLGKKDNQKMLKISRIGFAILLAGIGFFKLGRIYKPACNLCKGFIYDRIRHNKCKENAPYAVCYNHLLDMLRNIHWLGYKHIK